MSDQNDKPSGFSSWAIAPIALVVYIVMSGPTAWLVRAIVGPWSTDSVLWNIWAWSYCPVTAIAFATPYLEVPMLWWIELGM